MANRVLILSASVGSGHTMAADALAGAFHARGDAAEVAELDVLQTTNELYRALYDDTYFALVKTVPWLVGWGYDANDVPFKLGRPATAWDRINNTETVRAIRKFRPTTVVCTHFLPMRIVSLMIAHGSLDCTVSAVTTDYDFQGLWLTGTFSRFFVAREETKDHLAAIGVPEARLTVSGIPVRPGLDQPIDRSAVLQRYGLRDDVPVLLISAGAAGGDYIRSIVTQIIRIREPFQAVVVCGRNETLRREISELAVDAPHVRVLGYTTDMADLMRVASLFVGKPGGLSSSECMAAGLPMVVINPIPGQEVRNSDFLLEEGAAVRCNYETTVGKKVERLLADPDRIPAMRRASLRIGMPAAARDVATAVMEETDGSLWISRSAQKSILKAAEDGHAPEDATVTRRLVTLAEVSSGAPVAVVTAAELSRIEVIAEASATQGGRLYVSLDRLHRLRRSSITATLGASLKVRNRRDPDLLLMLRRLIGPGRDIGLAVDPGR